MKHQYRLLLLLFWLLAGFTAALSQTLEASLLELNFQDDGYPERFTLGSDGFYFTVVADQLWYSDGTFENTYMVKDFESGSQSDIETLTKFGSSIVFSAYNGGDNKELWISDGTEMGTVQLTDRDVGFGTEDIYSLIEYNGKIFFTASDGVNGYELWTTDGTPDGTEMLIDIEDNGNSSPDNFLVFDGNLYFAAYTADFGLELWQSNGTSAGTNMLLDINPGSSSGLHYSNLVAHGDHFYFYANDGISGNELWKSDGTSSGTNLLKDIRSGSGSSANTLTAMSLNDKMAFYAYDNTTGFEIWLTDGTESGTVLFNDLFPGNQSGVVNDDYLIPIGNRFFFQGNNGSGENGLWIADIEGGATTFVQASSPIILTVDSTSSYAVYYAGGSFWKTNGTSEGTVIISQEVSPTNISVHDEAAVAFEDRIFFSGKTEVNGTEVWSTDGSSSGTELFYDVNREYGSRPSIITAIEEKQFFRGSLNGRYTLGVTDGTVANTQFLKTDENDLTVTDDVTLYNFNGKCLFAGRNPDVGSELFISDGTKEGTFLLKDIKSGNGDGLNEFVEIVEIDGIAYFAADDGVNGTELWRTDGTNPGTYMLNDLDLGGDQSDSSFPTNFTKYNGYIYFSAQINFERALFRTNGTASSTEKIIDLPKLRSIDVINNQLLMVAQLTDEIYGPKDLVVSDGTAAGTNLLYSFGGGGGSDIRIKEILDDKLYFVAKHPENFMYSVYVSDATLEGTILLYESNEYDTGIRIPTLVMCGDYVYFITRYGNGSTIPRELWRTDGTPENTLLIENFPTDVFRSFKSLVCSQDNLFYLTDLWSKSIWTTQGEPFSAKELDVEIMAPNNFQENTDGIFNLSVNGNLMYLDAYSKAAGSELHVMDVSPEYLGLNSYNSTIPNTEDRLIIYPNPSNKRVNIYTMEGKNIKKIEVFDLLGKKIMDMEFDDNVDQRSISTETLDKGIYIIESTTADKKKINSKLLKN